MRVHKPKVEYKLALQEKPQGSILAYYYKTNNLTRINWLNTRLIIASNKIRHEIPFKTKRVKYTAIWKKSIKIVKRKQTILFFYTAHNVFIPSSTIFYYFPSSMFFIPLHHNFNIFPQFHYFPSSMLLFPPPQFYYFSSSSSSSSSSLPLFSLLLLILIVFPFPPHFGCFDRVDVGSMWRPCGVDVGLMWGWCGVDVGLMWGRCGVDVGSM